ncbi:uncharacterized protein LOC117783605 [Drosophila innubila]|uniref:uncharacterized protein LOC117783605 n=1 Tax=Drosophila innubila TaxID=198719 RepID=UPI00148B5880|nr:uncharacterized protein LOC117783605 [Drosophila innubila]
MDTGRILIMFGLIAVAGCLVSAQEAVTENPGTYVDRTNGVATSIPGTRDPKDAGPHKTKVIVNGQIVTSYQFPAAYGSILLFNNGGEGSSQLFGDYETSVVNGGLQLQTRGKKYNFPAKETSVKSQEKVDIDGKEATLEYDNGNIVIELTDGTLFAKTEGGLFSGNRQSYVNRAQIKEAALREASLGHNQVRPHAVPNYVYNQRGNTFLQNEAGSIYTRPDGKTVLVGANGQTIVTDRDSSSDEDKDDNDDHFHSGSNIIINGQSIGGGSFSTGQGGVMLFNDGGEGSTQFFGNYQINIVNGGIQLRSGGKVYNFPAKDPSVKSQEKIDINGNEATLEYDNGNIVIELADGTVFAKTEDGLFSGNRQSYENRAQIKENALREAALTQQRVQQEVANIQSRIQAEMRELDANLQRTLGNIGFY